MFTPPDTNSSKPKNGGFQARNLQISRGPQFFREGSIPQKPKSCAKLLEDVVVFVLDRALKFFHSHLLIAFGDERRVIIGKKLKW